MSKYNVLIVLPLHYSEDNYKRMLGYLKEAKLKNTSFSITLTPIFFMSQGIYEKSNLKIHKVVKHDNSANGVTMFIAGILKNAIKLEKYDFIIYLEESCEPMSKNWALKLIADLINGETVSGWHWNFRAKSRPNTEAMIFSKGIRRSIGYKNFDYHFGISNISSNVIDVPSFRYECIAFRVKDLIKNLYIYDGKILESELEPSALAVITERFYWEKSRFGECPNLQFKLLSDSQHFPLFWPKNIRLFRELKPHLKKDSSYRPTKILLRKLNISHVFFCLQVLIKSFIKFIILRNKLINRFNYL